MSTRLSSHDITFCIGEEYAAKCPLRSKCHRWIKNHKFGKDEITSQFVQIPYIFNNPEDNDDEGHCEQFWEK